MPNEIDGNDNGLKSRKFLLSLSVIGLLAVGVAAAPVFVSEALWDKYVQLYDRGVNAALIVLSAYLGYNLGSKKVTP